LSTNWPKGVGRRVLASIDSTNSEAARIAAGGLVGPEWILALNQTGARGRRGRAWSNPPGNFAATLVCRPVGAPAHVALHSFVAALALADAFTAATGRAEPFSLKWPNDVLLNGGKVAGILLESAGAGGALDYLSIGIGVNLIHAPDRAALEPGALAPVSLLQETGARVTPEEFLDLLAPAYAARAASFDANGFAPIREAWLTRAARLGQVITARSGATTTTGTFETVDDTGALVLKTAKGRQTIPAADVFF